METFQESKQFTATGVMMLVEEGKIGLDDKVTRYLTNAPPSWADIKVRNLLTHTSGLGDYPSDFDFRRDYTEDKLLTKVTATSLATCGGVWFEVFEMSVLNPSRIGNPANCRLILWPLKCLAHENRSDSLGITARFLYSTEPLRPHIAERAFEELGRFTHSGISQHRVELCGEVDAMSNCGGGHNLRPAGCGRGRELRIGNAGVAPNDREAKVPIRNSITQIPDAILPSGQRRPRIP